MATSVVVRLVVLGMCASDSGRGMGVVTSRSGAWAFGSDSMGAECDFDTVDSVCDNVVVNGTAVCAAIVDAIVSFVVSCYECPDYVTVNLLPPGFGM